jgi:hypothetical protein
MFTIHVHVYEPGDALAETREGVPTATAIDDRPPPDFTVTVPFHVNLALLRSIIARAWSATPEPAAPTLRSSAVRAAPEEWRIHENEYY